jgi:BirA family biotin operon repressor/biotin-[acetyl-CoA-carboxylase] ligase
MSTRAALLRLLADGGFHSGTDLGAQLGVTRAAVCKAIHTLGAQGLDIDRVSGRGYRLAQPFEPLDARRILKLLADCGEQLKHSLTVLDEVDSTNRYLLERADELESGAACLAEAQPSGRGRRGRRWIATPYHNLMLSMLWRFTGGPGELAGLTLAAGVAVADALDAYGLGDVRLKWPNDLLWNDRKLGGLLAEVRGETNGPTVVVLGVGVNGYLSASHAAEIDQPWADIAGISGKSPARNRLAALVLLHLRATLDRFAREGLDPFRRAFERRHHYHGKVVRLLDGAGEITGTVQGIDQSGAIVLEMRGGEQRRFHSGEISLRGAP